MARDESIISVIQQMVQEGQPREKILLTLGELGVSEDQAKKLLLIAEADTFTLLKKEIGVLVDQEFSERQQHFDEEIHQELSKIEDEEKEQVRDLTMGQLGDVQKTVLKEARGFEDRVNKTISASEKGVSLVKVALDSINNRLAQMEVDVEQLKVHKFRKRSMIFSYIMLVLGAVLLLTAVALLVLRFTEVDSTQFILICVMIIASIALMFASIVG